MPNTINALDPISAFNRNNTVTLSDRIGRYAHLANVMTREGLRDGMVAAATVAGVVARIVVVAGVGVGVAVVAAVAVVAGAAEEADAAAARAAEAARAARAAEAARAARAAEEAEAAEVVRVAEAAVATVAAAAAAAGTLAVAVAVAGKVAVAGTAAVVVAGAGAAVVGAARAGIRELATEGAARAGIRELATEGAASAGIRKLRAKAFFKAVLQNDLGSLPEEQKIKVLGDYQDLMPEGMVRFTRVMIRQIIQSPCNLSDINTPSFLHEMLPTLNQLQTKYRQLKNPTDFSLQELQSLIREGRNLAGELFTRRAVDWKLVAELASNL